MKGDPTMRTQDIHKLSQSPGGQELARILSTLSGRIYFADERK